MILKSALTLFAFAFGLTLFLGHSSDGTVSARSGGADIYSQHCATCHGGDGKANTPRGRRKGATDLTKSKISTAQGISVIKNGRELMPAFKNALSEEEINAVMAYVRGFRKS